jgi:RNA 2',3'-cyclic 3'-phosphodiesterase
MVASIRAFFALTLDERGRARAMELAGRLDAHPGRPKQARMMAAASLHLTLKYLGATEDGQVPALAAIAQRAAGKTPALSVREARFTAFPDASRGHVVVLELAGDGALAGLAADVEAEAVALGFAPERRPFRPHVTLARLPAPADLRAWIDEGKEIAFEARLAELALMKSEPTGAGPRYVPLAVAPLRGSSTPV